MAEPLPPLPSRPTTLPSGSLPTGQTSSPDPSGGGDYSWLIPLLVSLGGTIGGRAVANASASNAVPPELSQLLQMSAQRAAYQNPMFQATTQGLYQMLPNFARQGTSLSGSLTNQVPAPMLGSGGGGSNPLTSLNPLKNPLMSALLGAAGSDLAKGNIPFQGAIDKLKQLFGGRGTGPVPGTTRDNPIQWDWPTADESFLHPQMGMPDYLPGAIDLPPLTDYSGDQNNGLSGDWMNEGVG